MALTKNSFEGTALAPAHIGDDAATAIANAANEVTDGMRKAVWKEIAIGAGGTSEEDLGWDLPATALVHDVLVRVDDPEVTGATKTLDGGLNSAESGGDADGFFDGIDVSTAGLKRGQATVTAGVLSANTRGALLADYVVGTNADDRGIYREKPHASGSVTAKSLSITRGSTFVEFRGAILVHYTDLAEV